MNKGLTKVWMNEKNSSKKMQGAKRHLRREKWLNPRGRLTKNQKTQYEGKASEGPNVRHSKGAGSTCELKNKWKREDRV